MTDTTWDITTERFQLNPQYQFQWEPAQNCHVLLYPEGLIQLSDSAAAIIERCVQPTTMAELVAGLQQQFPAAETLADDVREFLLDAQQQRWLVPG